MKKLGESVEVFIMWLMFAMVLWANILVTAIFFGHYVFSLF